jgi:peptidoglycan/xylan/chitin deacetylase (PgdA/CDA1 family)
MVLPINYLIQAGNNLLDTSIGISGLVSHGPSGGDAAWALTEVSLPAFLRPSVPSAPSKVFKLQVTVAPTLAASYQLDWTINTIPNMLGYVWFVGRGENLSIDQGGTFFLSENGTFSNYYTANIGYAVSAGDESVWRFLPRLRSAFSVSGGAPNPALTFTRARIRLNAAVGTTPTYYICPVWANVASKPIVTFSFDDRNTNDFINAYPYLNARGLVGSLCLTSSLGTLEPGNIRTMQQSGWSMHNHSDSHPDFALLTAQQIRAEVTACQSYLHREHLDSGPSAMVLPFGSRSSLVDEIVREFYPYTFLANGTNAPMTLWDGAIEAARVPRVVMDTPTPAATIIANVNTAVNVGQSFNLYGHDVTAGAGAGKTDLATFQSVVDHITKLRDANVVQVRTLESLITGLQSPRIARL